MFERFNEPDYSWVIESMMPSGRHIEYFRIDQVVGQPVREEALQRIENQVARHLSQLGNQTGLRYMVHISAPPKDVDRWLMCRNIVGL